MGRKVVPLRTYEAEIMALEALVLQLASEGSLVENEANARRIERAIARFAFDLRDKWGYELAPSHFETEFGRFEIWELRR